MKYLLYCVLLLAFVACQSPTNKTSSDEPTWQTIFDGKSLDGWTPKFTGYKLGENYKNTFRVEDGAISVNYDEYDDFTGTFGHLFYKEKLSHYRLQISYRFHKEQVPNGPGWAFRNSGVMLHCQSPESMLLDQEFPVSIEAQFLGGNGTDQRSTMNMCSPGTNIVLNDALLSDHCYSSSSLTFHGDNWVHIELEVNGAEKIVHKVLGESVLEYSNPQIGGGFIPEGFPLATGTLLGEGYISLQAESHPVQFTNIKIMDLSK